MKRRLSLTEGTSDKFWYIDAEGDQVTVSYGRRGTAGTTKTKSYPSAEKALEDAHKQVAAKVKKGYTDEAGADDAALTPVEPTAPKAAPATKAEPAAPAPAPIEPIEVSGDGDDLGLWVTPYEQAWDLSTPVSIELETGPFDAEAEAERAARVADHRVYDKNSYISSHRWQFTEPLFTTHPSPERAQFWRDFLDAADEELAARSNRRRAPFIADPIWFPAAIEADAGAPAAELVKGSGRLRLLSLRPLWAHQAPEAMEAARAMLPATLPTPLVTQQSWGGWNLADQDDYFRAAALESHSDQIAAALREVPRGAFGTMYHSTIELCMLMPTAAERVAVAKHTGARLMRPDQVVPWLVSTGAAGFGLLIDSLDEQAKDVAEEMLVAAGYALTGPGAVALFADALTTKGAAAASAWLKEHPALLLGASLNSARAEAVAPFLRELAVEQLRAALDQTRGGVRGQVEAILAEADLPRLDDQTPWWAEAAARTEAPTRGTLPAYLSASALPPLLVGDAILAPEQVELLLAALASGDVDHPLVTAVREHAEPTSRDRFAVALLNLWMANAAPSKNNWLMTGAGLLGGDRFVHALTPMVREWPGVSQHKRAVTGLDALRNVGTDTALQSISGIAAKVKFAALKKRANEAMSEIAESRGFTREQLEDRVVPDGGLDERGTRTFDYGSRQFLVNLTPEAKVIVRDLVEGRPTGKPKTTLPNVLKSDDAEAANAAREEFKILKKTLTGLAKTQSARFEKAMMSGRRWSFAEHQQFIARQPLLRGLLSALVWGIYDNDQQLLATVRFDEDGSPVDPDDEPVEISDDQQLGIVHPVDLAPEQISQWADVLADYELVAPFQQLDRPVYSLPADQGDEVNLLDIPQGEFPAGKLFGAFTKYGWQRGSALDNGVYVLHALQFESADLTAVIMYSGMWMGPMNEQEDQAIESVYLLDGIRDAQDLGYGDGWRDDNFVKVPWNRAPKALVNEVIATLQMIAG
ncbi:DUF4132 domain-containing protein [Propionibacteriaceae bacterium Y1923]